ncbi:MAG: DUF3795 domain-containing protein [Nitrospirae bacterium]|nr:DUF3795 domain-containing protein [Nitrospirota bacterium]
MVNKISLIAPCGMNCGICIAYLRKTNKCCGCRGSDLNKPVTRVRCKIKTCEFFQNGKSKYCFKCKKFPCDNLKRLDARYKTKYNMSMIENLNNIKNIGIRKFVNNEQERWRCPECRGTKCVHIGYCLKCSSHL